MESRQSNDLWGSWCGFFALSNLRFLFGILGVGGGKTECLFYRAPVFGEGMGYRGHFRRGGGGSKGPKGPKTEKFKDLPPGLKARGLKAREEKQHKHKFFGPDCPRTLTLTPRCPRVKKFLRRKAAGKRHFPAAQLFQCCSAVFRSLQRSFW